MSFPLYFITDHHGGLLLRARTAADALTQACASGNLRKDSNYVVIPIAEDDERLAQVREDRGPYFDGLLQFGLAVPVAWAAVKGFRTW